MILTEKNSSTGQKVKMNRKYILKNYFNKKNQYFYLKNIYFYERKF